MQEVYTKRNSEISTALNFSPEGVPSYIVDLREWANKKVRDYEKSRPKLSLITTYKVPGSTGITYTITVSENQKVINCSCPGFTFRRSCKHTKNLYKGVN